MSDIEINPEAPEPTKMDKPKKKVSEKQRQTGLENLKKGREILKLRREEKLAIKQEYLQKQAEYELEKDKKKAVYKEVLLKREQDNQAKAEPIAEPIAEPPKKSVKIMSLKLRSISKRNQEGNELSTKRNPIVKMKKKWLLKGHQRKNHQFNPHQSNPQSYPQYNSIKFLKIKSFL
jgi:hypothetical protein